MSLVPVTEPVRKSSGRRNRWLRRKFALWMVEPFREGTLEGWATEHGVSERTLRRWARRPEFQTIQETAKERWRAKLPLLAEAVAQRVQKTGDAAAFKTLAEWSSDYQTKSKVTVENDPYLAILEKIAQAS